LTSDVTEENQSQV